MFTKSLVNMSTIMLINRIVLGIVFVAHGGQKVFGWFGGRGLNAVVEGFHSNLQIPYFLGYIASFTEFFGGILILLGLFTRIFSAGIMIVMATAIVLVHYKNGFFNPGGFEFQLTLFTIALGIFLFGPGEYSLDHQFDSKILNKEIIADRTRIKTYHHTHA